MDNNNFLQLVKNKDLETINSLLGQVAPFFWVVYANYAIDGTPVTQAVERTFKLIQTYLSTDAIGILHRQTRTAASSAA